MKILVVGGTADGRYLATALFELGFDVTYSIAGIVRKAKLPCEVVSGGFTQFGGLAKFVIDNHITHLVDVTHPFAKKMSNKIAVVSKELSLPAIRFHRKAWPKNANDNWIELSQWADVIEQTACHNSLFITAGQITEHVMEQLAAQSKQVLIRTAMPMKINLPENVTWLKAIGPFQLQDELQLIEQYQIDAIISKNSGGDSTYAKIQAASQTGIPVYQFKRPELQATTYQFDNQDDCIALLQSFNKQVQTFNKQSAQ